VYFLAIVLLFRRKEVIMKRKDSPFAIANDGKYVEIKKPSPGIQNFREAIENN